MKHPKIFAALVVAAVVALVATAVTTADQIELTNRELPNGDVQVLVLDDQTKEVSVTINGTPTGTRPATEREIQAGDRVSDDVKRRQAAAALSTVIADIRSRGSVNPDVARAEQALLQVVEILGVE